MYYFTMYHLWLNALLRSHFCSALSFDGKMMSNSILRSPLLLGSFEIGIPSFGITTLSPGFTISVTEIGRILPSKVVKLRMVPVRASSREIFRVAIRSFPSRLKIAWGFSSTTKIRSDGVKPGSWFPFSGKVIFVPFFHPGFISIFNTSSTVFRLQERSEKKKENDLEKQENNNHTNRKFSSVENNASGEEKRKQITTI